MKRLIDLENLKLVCTQHTNYLNPMSAVEGFFNNLEATQKWIPIDVEMYRDEIGQGWHIGLRKVLADDDFLDYDRDEVLCEFSDNINDVACEVVALRHVLAVLLAEIELKQLPNEVTK